MFCCLGVLVNAENWAIAATEPWAAVRCRPCANSAGPQPGRWGIETGLCTALPVTAGWTPHHPFFFFSLYKFPLCVLVSSCTKSWLSVSVSIHSLIIQTFWPYREPVSKELRPKATGSPWLWMAHIVLMASYSSHW